MVWLFLESLHDCHHCLVDETGLWIVVESVDVVWVVDLVPLHRFGECFDIFTAGRQVAHGLGEHILVVGHRLHSLLVALLVENRFQDFIFAPVTSVEFRGCKVDGKFYICDEKILSHLLLNTEGLRHPVKILIDY